MFTIELERPEHAPEIEALLDEAFGPGRYAKAAQRLRRPVQQLLRRRRHPPLR